MRKITRIKLLIISLGIIFGFSSLFNTNFNNYDNSKGSSETELKKAGYWEIGSIEIDDDDPTKNWLITAATYDWCSGSGTWNNPYIIENVTINGQNSGSCIRVLHSNSFFVIKNCTLYNSGSNLPTRDAGIKLEYTNNGMLINNTCLNNNGFGITIEDSSNNTILENIVNNNGRSGICLACDYIDANNNTIVDNIVNDNNEEGIILDGSYNEQILNVNYNNISSNTVAFNSKQGIYIYFSEYNTISNNTIFNNTEHGIHLRYGNFCKITRNYVFNNTDGGIYLIFVDESEVINNSLDENSYGIYLYSHCDKNNISINEISKNKLYGMLLGDNDVNDNVIYNNSFIENTINALDSGINTQWDYNSIGNYWDDYSGVDANDDGIGDTPYDVPPAGGSADNYPIWDDGDDLAPDIIINSPSMNDAFGLSAPTFDITINDDSLINITWYTIDEGTTNYTFSGFSGTINQTAWYNKGTEIMTLRFYANDSLGHIGFKDVLIWKDLVAPKITINSPTPNQLCGITAPTFTIQIIEPNLQEKRYSLNGRPNITFTTETQFRQTEWNQVGNGTVSIIFYAIDKVGNTNSSEVIVRKDAYVPDITIYSPLDDQKFGKTSPDYNITIIEEDLASTWYTIEGVAGTFSFTGLTGIIDQDAWDDAPEGEITITFYAIDGAGNLGSENVVVIKSIPSKPEISGYNLFLLLGILAVASILISKKLKRS